MHDPPETVFFGDPHLQQHVQHECPEESAQLGAKDDGENTPNGGPDALTGREPLPENADLAGKPGGNLVYHADDKDGQGQI